MTPAVLANEHMTASFVKCTIKQRKESTMTKWRTLKVTNEYREIVNVDTGSVRKVMLASDQQWAYLEQLRQKHSKNYKPLKHRPTVFSASKKIDKYLDKEKQQQLI